jgi:hypothetical protein
MGYCNVRANSQQQPARDTPATVLSLISSNTVSLGIPSGHPGPKQSEGPSGSDCILPGAEGTVSPSLDPHQGEDGSSIEASQGDLGILMGPSARLILSRTLSTLTCRYQC